MIEIACVLSFVINLALARAFHVLLKGRQHLSARVVSGDVEPRKSPCCGEEGCYGCWDGVIRPSRARPSQDPRNPTPKVLHIKCMAALECRVACASCQKVFSDALKKEC